MFPNVKINNKELVFAFLYSIYDALMTKKEIDLEKMDKMKAYTLSSFSEIFSEKIKLFSSNCDNFIKYLKSLQNFKIFEFSESHYEPDAQLPVLSIKQTHTEKKKIIEDEDIIVPEKSSRGTSFNSLITYDSFKDDFLNSGPEVINNDKTSNLNNNINNINNINDNDKSEKLIKEIEIKEIDKNDGEAETINPNENSISSNQSGKIALNDMENRYNNTCLNRSIRYFKVIIIIIVIVILILIGILLGIVFSK